MSQTPIISRIRGSLINRKCRELNNCPPTPATPRVANQCKKATSPDLYNRRMSKRFKANNNKSTDLNDSITSDYSTPKTTRTPTSAVTTSGGGSRSRTVKRVTHLIYKPLELDTESSNESMDFNYRRRGEMRHSKNTNKRTPTTTAVATTSSSSDSSPTKPLAIEAAPSPATRTTTNACETIGTESLVSSEPPTPPITPEKVISIELDDSPEKTEAVPSSPPKKKFVPGNVWIFSDNHFVKKSLDDPAVSEIASTLAVKSESAEIKST